MLIFKYLKINKTKSTSYRSLTEEVLHTKTKLDLTKLFYWGKFHNFLYLFDAKVKKHFLICAIGNYVLSTDSDILSTNECYFLAPFIQEGLKYLFITIADRDIRFIKHNPSPINNSYFFFLYNIRSVNPHETGCW